MRSGDADRNWRGRARPACCGCPADNSRRPRSKRSWTHRRSISTRYRMLAPSGRAGSSAGSGPGGCDSSSCRAIPECRYRRTAARAADWAAARWAAADSNRARPAAWFPWNRRMPSRPRGCGQSPAARSYSIAVRTPCAASADTPARMRAEQSESFSGMDRTA